MTHEAPDPFEVELLENALDTVADEMALTVCRSARSFVVKEALDFSTALFDGRGRMVAQGTCLPLHLGAMPAALDAILNTFADDLRPGDVFCTNDPYDGGTHLPDIVCVKPVFLREAIVGYAAVLAHMTDIGGRVAGGNACDSTEIYQEGLIIPPSRLYDAGKANTTLFRLIARNVRVPDLVMGDLRSEIAACEIGERGLRALVERHGQERFESLGSALLDYTERFTRSEIAKLPDGAYDFTDYIDDDGMGSGRIALTVRVTVSGDAMTIDFSGTSGQVKGAINSVHAFSASAAWAAVRSILDPGIPNNEGFFRAVRIEIPQGSIANPMPPAAVAARGLTGFRIADAVFGALARIAPDKVPAGGSSTPDTAISIGGHDRQRKPFVYIEFLLASWGGGPRRDGMDACTGLVINYSNTPGELLETEQPLRVERYAFVPDSGGPGEWRGGLALERHIRMLADEATVQIRSDRREVAPYGLEGGRDGTTSAVSIRRRNGADEQYPSKFMTTMGRDDVIHLRLAGGGGYGDPLKRDPDRVLDDLREGKVSVSGAARDYGVVVDPASHALDRAATEALRAERRNARP